MPAYLAALGLAPTVRTSKPRIVLHSNQYTATAAIGASNTPACRRVSASSSGKRADSSTGLVSETGFSALARIGPPGAISQLMIRRAMKLVMMVVITSWAPVRALR